MNRLQFLLIPVCFVGQVTAQQKSLTLTKEKYRYGPDSIAIVGIIKNLTNDQLHKKVQSQSFSFFWHATHPLGRWASNEK